MKPENAIEVTHLSKVFPLRHARKDKNGNDTHEHWALNDISFEIKKGESVGIIGPNGSGKSTLLQILAGVTKPTSGSVKIKGKVASILDIGAGFHPELSGRENVFLNGQIHGFSKKEIESKFDEIVAFSGIEKFIDEPVKNYSSGMYLRLAFSIMANLDFDVYLFDEVMSVGDAEFQLKTKGRFIKLVNNNKTIINVSHNIKSLTDFDKFITIEYSEMKSISSNSEVLTNYLERAVTNDVNIELRTINTVISNFPNYRSFSKLNINKIKFYQNGENVNQHFVSTLPIYIDMYLTSEEEYEDLNFFLKVNDESGDTIFSTSTILNDDLKITIGKNDRIVQCIIPKNLLGNKVYSIDVAIYKGIKKSLEKLIKDKSTINDILELSELKLEPLLFLDKVMFFKMKMILFNKYDFRNFNLTNTYLTPKLEWSCRELNNMYL